MKTVSAKLTALNLACAVLVVGVLYVLMNRELTSILNDRFINQGQTVAAAMAKSVEPFLVNHDLTSIQSALDQVLAIQDVEWAYVMAPDGQVLAHTFVPKFPDSLKEPSRSGKSVWQAILPGGAQETTVFSKPVLTGIVGSVHVGFSSRNLVSGIQHMERVTLLTILLVMLVATTGVAVVSARVTAPIRELTEAAGRLGVEGSAAFQSLAVRTNDEVGVLTRTFNRMVAEIREDRATLEQRVQQRTAELAARTAHLHALIENSPLGIVVLDPAGLIQMCNRAFERLFEWRQEEIYGKDLNTVIAPGDLAAEAAAMSQRTLAGKSMHLTSERRRRDGSVVDVEIDCVPLVVEGNSIGSFGLYQDISERKKYQEQLLEAKEAAEAATRTKSEFLANMSHEIRTPMNGIIGMTDLALDTDLTPEQRDYLGMVKSSADTLLTVINDILDFSKIEAGKMDLSPVEFNLRDSLGDTVKFIAFRAHQKGLELTCDIPSALPESVVGDPDRLNQIIVNLLGNALKFTERGEVGVKVEEESRAADHVLLHFSISDTGIGIPLAKQQLIFQAFSQADNSTTRHYGGTGLGLTISARLVEMMNGTIWVKSEPGVGSVFHFTARFGLAGNLSGAAEMKLPSDLEGMPVLVVDDNATNRRILCEVLKNWHMVPDLVDGGRAALKAMETATTTGGSHALILLDSQMPGMSGFDLAEHLQRNPDLTHAPIIMLTSAGIRGDADRCRKFGIAAYLTKPIKQSELLTAVLKVLGGAGLEAERPLVTGHRPTANRRGRRNILLAEDNAVNAKLAVRLLEKQGHAVRLAASGKEAVEAFLAEPFDLILMDVQMPEMDGFEATARIREKEKASGGHVPIVALTAHAMKGDEERCLGAGMDGYLSKPIRSNALEEALERHLQDNPPLSVNEARP